MTAATVHEPAEAGREHILSLIELRGTYQEWIHKLDALNGEYPSHVQKRVREDYRTRLDNVLEELASHVGTLTQDLDRLRAQVQRDTHAHGDSCDALQEGKLRHFIGEISDTAWRDEEAKLRLSVKQTEAALEESQDEMSTLEALLAQIHASGKVIEAAPAPAPATEPAFVPEPEIQLVPPQFEAPEADAFDPDATLEAPIATGSPAYRAIRTDDEPEYFPTAHTAEPEAEFLSQIDQAIEPRPRTPLSQFTGPLKRETEGRRCGDCGYVNGQSTQFCGVCGGELGA